MLDAGGPEVAVEWFGAWETQRRFETDPSGAEGDRRDPYERDRARIIHSAAFRRLQGKSQIFAAGWSGYLRTRVTHAMEVAQIARSIATNHGLPGSLAEAAALAHDLGHPPFGHNGEDALAASMAPYGGFEGNAQTFRIITRLEPLTTRHPGANLTRATLLSVLKYPGGHAGFPALYGDDAAEYAGWLYQGTPYLGSDHPPRSITCQIMDWADDVAYSLHDLEDGLRSQLFSPRVLDSGEVLERVARRVRLARVEVAEVEVAEVEVERVVREFQSRLSDGWSVAPSTALVREVVGAYVHRFVTASSIEPRGEGRGLFDLELRVRAEVRAECAVLKAITQELILRDQRTGVYARQAVRIVRDLFGVLLEAALGDLDDVRAALFPQAVRELLGSCTSEAARARVVCDFVADMTDAQASHFHERLFSARQSSPFAPL